MIAINNNQYHVYILKCSDGSYYTGITNNIERRLIEHQSGENPASYTFKRRPLELVFNQVFNDVNQAIAFEKQVKGWRREKKEAIINGEWDLLPELAKAKSQNRHRKPVEESRIFCQFIYSIGPNKKRPAAITRR